MDNQEEIDKQIEEFLNSVNKKVEELSAYTGQCGICKELTNEWLCLLPSTPDGLGFGKLTGDKTRLMFIPCCKEHDMDNKENINLLMLSVAVKNLL